MDPYKVLNVDYMAETTTIKKAFIKLARKWHPDVCKDINAEAKFKEINEAYNLLKSNKFHINNQKHEYYDELKNIVSERYPFALHVYKDILKRTKYDEDEFKSDFDKFDFVSIYSKLTKNK